MKQSHIRAARLVRFIAPSTNFRVLRAPGCAYPKRVEAIPVPRLCGNSQSCCWLPSGKKDRVLVRGSVSHGSHLGSWTSLAALRFAATQAVNAHAPAVAFKYGREPARDFRFPYTTVSGSLPALQIEIVVRN